jgi:hypothetical protein
MRVCGARADRRGPKPPTTARFHQLLAPNTAAGCPAGGTTCWRTTPLRSTISKMRRGNVTASPNRVSVAGDSPRTSLAATRTATTTTRSTRSAGAASFGAPLKGWRYAN